MDASEIKELGGEDAVASPARPHKEQKNSDVIENESEAGAAQREEEPSEGAENAAGGEDEEEAEEAEEESEDEEDEDAMEDDASEEDNDYEAQRQRNIERNQAMLRQLGLLVDTSVNSTSTLGSSADSATTSTSSSSALLPTDATLAAGFSLQTPKRKYKPRQKRNVDTPTRTSSRLQTKSRRSYAENSFFKTLSPEEQAKILADEKKARKKARKARENAEAEGEETEEQRNARNTNKWIGSRLYDSNRGITCHQCRQKTVDEKSTCANEFRIYTPARHHYCRRCLWNRYGEALDEVRKDPIWLCPSCRGVCNCSFCRKKRGQAPTGVLDTAILQKYSSVAEYLQKDRQEKPAVSEGELQKMKEHIEKEIKEGIRPSVPIATSASSQAEELNADLKDDLYYVEAIVEHRSTPRGLEYLIKWLGYAYELNTWEPAAHLNCPHLIKEYHIRNNLSLGAKRGRKKKILDDGASAIGSTPDNNTAEIEGSGETEKEKGEGDDDGDEGEIEEDTVTERQMQRPSQPKHRGRGRPRLVAGTGRGPRRSDSADDAEPKEGKGARAKKRKANEVPATKKDKKAKRERKSDEDNDDDEKKETKAKAGKAAVKNRKGHKSKPSTVKDVRKSPRRTKAAPPVASDVSAGRKSPRLAKREREGKTSDRKEEGEETVAMEDEERPKALYWDDPVEKGQRRRSAPILLSDDFIILGNGEVRGNVQEKTKKTKRTTGTTTSKKTKTKTKEASNKRGTAKANGTNKEMKLKKAAKGNKRAKSEQKTKANDKNKDDQAGEEEEEKPLYWETTVPGKRQRNPNMAYFSDFLFDSGPSTRKRRNTKGL